MISATVGLIARREITQRLRSKAFRLSTALVSGLLVVGVALPALSSDDGGDAAPSGEAVAVVVVGDVDASVAAAIEVAGLRTGQRVDVRSVPDRAAAEAALRSEEEDAPDVALVPGGEVLSAASTGFGGPGLAEAVATAVAEADALARAGVPADAVAATLVTPPLPVTTIAGAPDGSGWLLAQIGAMFIYATLLMYAAWMVNGVIEEKANRVVELLLSTVRPRELMAGKVLGLGAVGVVQTVAIFAPALVAGTLLDSIAVPDGAGRAAATILAWWLLGYLLYSVVSAGAGALVSRSEETQAVLAPVTLLLVGAYLTSIVAMDEPDGTVAVVASLVPFTAPVAMVARTLTSVVPAWQVVLAVALLVGTAAGLTVLAGRIYAGGLLRTGRRVPLRQAWAGARDAGG